ncbi:MULTISPECIES: hypothetical protein [Bacillus]|uniref:hypothetical protein n=1 Tax=Bacillus TaxID=1386 RepID=UPI001B0C7A94|nr:hypothetical protein [Bacillus sonorensis]MEC1437266.1 hypothetical protein [Bacillus sonorensis]GIN67599.1 hypothetical protein J41TS2_30200 [Bacillus sonorensis]
MNRKKFGGEGLENDLGKMESVLEGGESVKCVDINKFYDSYYDGILAEIEKIILVWKWKC